MKYKIEQYEKGFYVRYQRWWMPFWGWIGEGAGESPHWSWSMPASIWSFKTEKSALAMIKKVEEAPDRTIHVEVKDAQ